MTPAELKQKITFWQARLNTAINHAIAPENQYPAYLHQAMRYAADGGKRVRAILVYAAGEALTIPIEKLDAAACAVELIHAYSLVHDDLPAMDDDDLRRGKATVHKAFDEATAILAGDALQTVAFEVLTSDRYPLEAEYRVELVRILAKASGSLGMCGGQAIDLQSTGTQLNLAELEAMHIHKTGALIRACLLMACHTQSGVSVEQIEALDHYGKCIGLAFQIQDDVLDVEGSSETLGKSQGKDEAQNKTTFASLLGLSDARRRAEELFDDAINSLSVFAVSAQSLRLFTQQLSQRKA